MEVGRQDRRLDVPALSRRRAHELLRALSAFSLDDTAGAYEEIRPPTFALTETMMSTGPPAQVGGRHVRDRARRPLGDSHRRGAAHLDAPTARSSTRPRCLSGSAPRPPAFVARPAPRASDTRGCCGCTSSTRWSSSPTARPSRPTRPSPTSWRAPRPCCRRSGLTYRLLDLCTGDLGTASALHDRPRGLQPRRRPLARGLLGQLVPRLSRPAEPTSATAPSDGSTAFVHTVNGSALGWARMWAALRRDVSPGRRLGQAARRRSRPTSADERRFALRLRDLVAVADAAHGRDVRGALRVVLDQRCASA